MIGGIEHHFRPYLVADAMTEAGFARTEDFNSGDNAGVGYFEVVERHPL